MDYKMLKMVKIIEKFDGANMNLDSCLSTVMRLLLMSYDVRLEGQGCGCGA
jgi:hypothetical protein